MKIGYFLSCEENDPRALIRQAKQAEEAGFHALWISDHYPPWNDAQGHSAFVWSVIGALAEATDLPVTTGVTCPTIRTHPAIIAQAAATSAVMLPGRFFLGVGSGENLNEHVVGDGWPAPDERLEMLEEAIEVMRLLWQGGEQTHRGDFYDVVAARLYTLPEEPVEIAVAAAKPKAAELAARLGDALINTAPDKELIETFDSGGKPSRPKYGQITMCWAASEEEGAKTACEIWPNAALGGDLGYELPRPEHFEQATEKVTPEDIAEAIPCGPDVDRYVEDIREYERAGYTHIYFHQVGHDQEGFFRFWQDKLAPKLG